MSKNLNRRFFYDFLIRLANEQTNKVPEAIPIIIEDGTHNKIDEVDSTKERNENVAKIEKIEKVDKSGKNVQDQPPPLMQGSPRILKKVPTA